MTPAERDYRRLYDSLGVDPFRGSGNRGRRIPYDAGTDAAWVNGDRSALVPGRSMIAAPFNPAGPGAPRFDRCAAHGAAVLEHQRLSAHRTVESSRQMFHARPGCASVGAPRSAGGPTFGVAPELVVQ